MSLLPDSNRGFLGDYWLTEFHSEHLCFVPQRIKLQPSVLATKLRRAEE